jgi:hypothetical protein
VSGADVLSGPSYRWRCIACESVNAAFSGQCANCGCPARPRDADIRRCARLAALRADKVFPPADADLSAAASARPSSVLSAITVLACWAIVAVVVHLSVAPIVSSRAGGWVLNALMAGIAVLAALTAVIVYRSARSARSAVSE